MSGTITTNPGLLAHRFIVKHNQRQRSSRRKSLSRCQDLPSSSSSSSKSSSSRVESIGRSKRSLQPKPCEIIHHSSHPMTLLRLLNCQSDTAVLERKSCLKTSDSSSSSCKKRTVKFATFVNSNKVLALFKKHPHSDHDVPNDKLRWSTSEMKDIRKKFQLISRKHAPYYQDLLKDAYESVNASTGNDVKLSLPALSQCREARGLEAHIFDIESIQVKHCETVLEVQQVLQETGMMKETNMAATMIQTLSEKFSRASRVVATEMAQFDYHEALSCASNHTHVVD